MIEISKMLSLKRSTNKIGIFHSQCWKIYSNLIFIYLESSSALIIYVKHDNLVIVPNDALAQTMSIEGDVDSARMVSHAETPNLVNKSFEIA